MSDKITIVEIAKLANVSTATVSRIINKTGKVSEEKEKLVLDIVKQYDYKPSAIAKALQSSKSNTVGFIVPHINSPYYAQMFYETEIIAQREGFTLMLCNSESDKLLESKILNEFIAANVRAIVLMGGRLDDLTAEKKYLKEIENVNSKIPVISCADISELDCIKITQDIRESSLKLLEHLSKKGYTDVVLMGGYSHIRTTVKRRNAIIECAEKFGIKVRSSIIECDYSVESGSNAMQQLLNSGKMPQAIICINDLVAIGVLSEAYKNNLKVPDDVAIVGYDDLDISKYIYPGITTIASNYKEYAKTIVRAVKNVEQLDKTSQLSLETELIIRGTT